ncbi:MAG: GNAT family N-acetyltransferase [Solirubrobacteraceae bacterium]
MSDTRSAPTLTLRPLEPGDCEALLMWIETEDDLYQWSGARSFSWPLDRGQLLRDLDASRGPRMLFAATDDRGAMTGHVMLDCNLHHRLGLIGRVAIAPDRRGCGLGAALMRETVRYGFDELGLHRLQLAVYTFNAAAIACYRSVGFVVEGESRDSTRGSAGYWNSLTMSLLEPDYRRPLLLGDGVRIAGPRDADAIAALLTQRGHRHDGGETAQRLLAWAADPHGAVLVAEADGAVAGVVAAQRLLCFERAGQTARIVWLGVSEPDRDGAVQARLVEAATRWAAAGQDLTEDGGAGVMPSAPGASPTPPSPGPARP